MSMVVDDYPKTVALDGADIVIRQVEGDDVEAMQRFANTLPEHDLLFLSRDITHPKVIDAWVEASEEGAIHSLLAELDGRIVAASAVVRDPLGWSRHVGEIRLLVADEMRGRGLGGAMLLETFRVAMALGVTKMVAKMTPDQTGAIALFMGMGFRGEAMLKDHVMDRRGDLHDLAILSHDVARAAAELQAYGLEGAL